MGGLVFGFRDGEPVTPQEQGVEVESTFTVEPGETVTDEHGNTYTSTASDD
ncbi:hypothetical protein [Streptomyces sp. XY006]|uniref:hypothetical protein n=1 Tax=Streptomyces sp. XY006 TaxID=2021410 RepID=UPI0015C5C318|nr:hypothetical protein [Streptomyces sp. XY006]